MSPREITAQVTVTRDGICLEGRRVVETRSLSLAGVDWNIPPLREALRRVVREGGEDQVTRTVVIRAEGGIEFRLIKHVMYTAALAGFSSISFETGADRRGALVCRPQSNGR